MYICKNSGCDQAFKFTMQLARHEPKCLKLKADRKYLIVEGGA